MGHAKSKVTVNNLHCRTCGETDHATENCWVKSSDFWGRATGLSIVVQTKMGNATEIFGEGEGDTREVNRPGRLLRDQVSISRVENDPTGELTRHDAERGRKPLRYLEVPESFPKKRPAYLASHQCGFGGQHIGLVDTGVHFKWHCRQFERNNNDSSVSKGSPPLCRICEWQSDVALAEYDLEIDVKVPRFEGPPAGSDGCESFQKWLVRQPGWIHEFDKEAYGNYWENFNRKRQYSREELRDIWTILMEGLDTRLDDWQSFAEFLGRCQANGVESSGKV